MQLGNIDLNLLVALDALLRERNVSRAAERVGLGQPAMSAALRRLRALFGDELLIRVGREYHLTALAEELVDPVAEILRLVEQTVDHRPEFHPERDRRVFRIACSDAVEYVLIRPVIMRIEEQAPNVSLEVQAVAGWHTTQLVEEGDLDIVIADIGLFESNLVKEKLFEDRWVLVGWAGSPELGDSVTTDELMTMPNAIYHWGWFDRTHRNPRPYDVLEDLPVRIADQFHFMRLFMLRGTRMVALHYERLAKELQEAAELKILKAPFELPPVQHAMMWHPRNAHDPAHRWLREQLVEAAATL
jgi:LysR family transcriptional regulator, nod-box dependent transcriptional activator